MASGNTVLNYPIETAEAEKSWASKHVCNNLKSIIAFSLNLHNANDNLRRYGYKRGFREKALYHYGKYVNQPAMTSVPFTGMDTPYYKEIPYVEGVTIDSILAGHVAP